MTNALIAAPGAVRRRAHKKPRSYWTLKNRDTFLLSLAETANVSVSARAAGMSLGSAYVLKQRDPEFARLWREALDCGYSELELALLRMARDGIETIETMQEGETLSITYRKTTLRPDFTVAIRLLESHRDEVEAYRRAHEPEGDAAEELDAHLMARTEELRGRLLEQRRLRLALEEGSGGADGSGDGAGEEAGEGAGGWADEGADDGAGGWANDGESPSDDARG